jgi:hypothetical protein
MAWPPSTHQDVQDDLTNGHGWAASLAARFAVGETMLASPIVKSGRYYGPSGYSTSTSQTAMSGRIYLLPFYLPTTVSVDRITINCATLAASTTGRCGIYAADTTTLLPSTLLVDGGTVSGATTGLKETIISASLSGLVYFAFVADGATWTAVGSTQVPNVFGSSTGSLGSGAPGLYYDQASGTTTLPATLPGSLNYNASSAPTGMVRAV